MTTLEFVWTVSRARDSYGYNICSLRVRGQKVASCNGGGYDMKGTALGKWVARAYRDRLLALTPDQMPAQGHWERAEKPMTVCTNLAACEWTTDQIAAGKEYRLPPETPTCPHCGAETRIDHHDGRRVDDGRYFYALTFHDPSYDPGKATIGKEATDRTLGGATGETVEQAEAEGKSIGLERYQAFYSASSKIPTERHTVPLIDGACGMRSVEGIMRAIDLTLEYVPTRKRDDLIYILHDAREGNRNAEAA